MLISQRWFRVGSDRYEKENNSFGITTLRKSHVEPYDDHVVFKYRGKRGITQRQHVIDARLVKFVDDLMKTPGTRLFRYRDGRKWIDLDARDVNEYLEDIAGFPYTAKDFRTWGGSMLAATVLADIGPAKTKTARNKNVLTAVRLVAAELGNTPAICRKSYVHPRLIDAIKDDPRDPLDGLERPRARKWRPPCGSGCEFVGEWALVSGQWSVVSSHGQSEF